MEYSHIDPRTQRTPTIEFKIEFSYKRLFILRFILYNSLPSRKLQPQQLLYSAPVTYLILLSKKLRNNKSSSVHFSANNNSFTTLLQCNLSGIFVLCSAFGFPLSLWFKGFVFIFLRQRRQDIRTHTLPYTLNKSSNQCFLLQIYFISFYTTYVYRSHWHWVLVQRGM